MTDSRLSLLPIPGGQTRYFLACFQNRERVPLALHGAGVRLFIQQAIEVVRDHCQTVSYAYRLQSDDDVWLLRWEYYRERPRPDYEYPLAHLHVNAEFVEPASMAARLEKAPSDLHIPTTRLPLELVLLHLITEWGVTSKSADWRQILGESPEGFEARRTAP